METTTPTGRLERTLGVTRIARVTGLDRSGVEVACAVRPRGYILQVCQGKGLTFEQARTSARMEAAELWAAERPDPLELVYATGEEIAARHGVAAVVACVPWDERVAWCRGRSLPGGGRCFVPAQAVYCPPEELPPLGERTVRWSSNGMGAHRTRAGALRHALFEAIERDQLARTAPHGLTATLIRERLVAPRGAPGVGALVARLQERGFLVHLLDLTPAPGSPGRIALPTAGAILVDEARGPVMLTAGYACRATPDEALLSALLEAAQSRLTDIHGAREDITPEVPEESERLIRWCERTTPMRTAARMVRARTVPGVDELVGRIVRAGSGPVVAVDLAPRGLGIAIVKVLAAGLEVSELLG